MPIIQLVTYEQLIKHYGSQRAAGDALKAIDGLGVKQSSVHEWKTRGRIPHPRQCQYELLTKGVLKAERPYRRAA